MPFQDILFVEGLKNIRSKLPDGIFSRISKSYIVNKRHITSMNKRSDYIMDIRISLGEISGSSSGKTVPMILFSGVVAGSLGNKKWPPKGGLRPKETVHR